MHHHCSAAMSAFVKKLFEPKGCTPAPIIPVTELALYLGLMFSLFYRHRENLLPKCKAAKRLRETGRSSISRLFPWEGFIMLIISTQHWFFSVYNPLLSATIDDSDAVLGGVDFWDWTTIFMVVYIAGLEFLEARHFSKNVLGAYYKNKNASQVAESSDEKEETEEDSPMLEDVEKASSKVTVIKTATETPTAPLTFWQRVKARHAKRKAEMPKMTAMRVLASYQTRAFFKASMTTIFLLTAGEQLCELQPNQYLDSQESALPMMIVVTFIYLMRGWHMITLSQKFSKAEITGAVRI